MFKSGALMLFALLANAAGGSSPLGEWSGESICTTDAPACHDEKVVLHIKPIGRDPATVFVQADKWLDGKLVTMFEGPWDYDKVKGTLSWKSQGRMWLLNVNASTLEGTLTMPDGMLFRRMKLTRLKQ